jgi:hypothetical protein
LSLRSIRNPVVFALIICVSIVSLVLGAGWAFILWEETVMNPKPHYTERVDSITIVSSEMNWVRRGSEPSIYIIGMLTNRSDQAWYSLEFECRFFNQSGVMVDAATAGSHQTVLPADNAAFRVVVSPSRPTNDYTSFKIVVSNARNAKARL